MTVMNTKTTDQRRLWAAPDAEVLSATSPDEAIQEILDGFEESDAPTPETVTVAEYKPFEFVLAPGSILERTLEVLDDECQHEGFEWEPTDRVKAAEAELVAALHDDYQVTNFESTGITRTVNVEEWK